MGRGGDEPIKSGVQFFIIIIIFFYIKHIQLMIMENNIPDSVYKNVLN